MEALYLDTHAALWLYGGRRELFTPRALRLIDEEDLVISPAVLLEIQYLKESQKMAIKMDTFLRDMHAELGVRICDIPFASVMIEASRVSWTREPFDRLITAQAAVNECRLITRDKMIRKNYKFAIWD